MLLARSQVDHVSVLIGWHLLIELCGMQRKKKIRKSILVVHYHKFGFADLVSTNSGPIEWRTIATRGAGQVHQSS